MPIIVLSVKGEEKTKVEALDVRSDDFVTKPVGMDELLARGATEPGENATHRGEIKANHHNWGLQDRCRRVPSNVEKQ